MRVHARVKVTQFYSHVICLGTKICDRIALVDTKFYSHVICLGTKITNYG